MSTLLGNATKPTWGYEWSGVNTFNQNAVALTLPAGGPWNVVGLGAWFAGKTSNVNARLVLWSAAGAVLGQSGTFVATGRALATANSDNYETPGAAAFSPVEVAGGTTVWVGIYRDPAGGEQFALYSSGTHYDKSNTAGFPAAASMSGASTDSSHAFSAYLRYELANSLPNAAVINTVGGGTSGSSALLDLTPDVVFTHSDPDGDPVSSWDLQVDTTTGNGVEPDWASLFYSGTNQTTGIVGNTVTKTLATIARGQWYAARARTADAVGDGPWSATFYFRANSLPTVGTRTPAASGFAYIHNLATDLNVWTAAGTNAKPRLQFVYNDANGHQSQKYQIRIYTASTGGADVYGGGQVAAVVASGSTITADITYGMLNGDQASSERWWTVEVWDSLGESSGESARTAFKVKWGQAVYEANPGASSSAWAFSAASVAANTYAAFLYRSATGSGGTGATAWKTSIGSVTVQAWMNVLVRLSTKAVGTNPSLADMTFSYYAAGTVAEKWTASPVGEFALSTDVRRFGARSYKVSVASGTIGDRTLYPFRETSGDDIVVAPDTEYTLSAFVKTEAPLTGGELRLRACRAGSVSDIIAESDAITDTSAAPDGWQRVTLTFTTDTGSGLAFMRPVLTYVRNSGVTEAFWTDCWKLEEGAVATAWMPGFISSGMVMDVSGLQIDASLGSILRLRGSNGGLRDTVELGPNGFLFGGDTPLASERAHEITAGQGSVITGPGLVSGPGGSGTGGQWAKFAHGSISAQYQAANMMLLVTGWGHSYAQMSSGLLSVNIKQQNAMAGTPAVELTWVTRERFAENAAVLVVTTNSGSTTDYELYIQSAYPYEYIQVQPLYQKASTVAGWSWDTGVAFAASVPAGTGGAAQTYSVDPPGHRDLVMLGPFTFTNLAGSATTQADHGGLGTTNARMRVGWAGKIVGVSVRGSALCTGGSAAFRPTIQGAAGTVVATINTTNTQTADAQGVDTFGASDVIGVQAVSSSLLPAATTEYAVWLFAVVYR